MKGKPLEAMASRKKLLGAGCVVVVLAATACTLTFASTAQNETGAQTVYREDTVLRGDLVVGVSESATATLKTHSITVAIDALLDEVYVKAGQSIHEGDPIASLDTEDLEDELYDLQLELVTAQVSLTQAQLQKEQSEIEAKNTYESALASSDVAQSTYELTVESLELAVSQAQKKVNDLQSEIIDYTRMLANITGDYDDYADARDDYLAAKSAADEAKQACEELKASEGEASQAYLDAYQYWQALNDDYQELYELYLSLYEDYTETYSDMTDEDAVREKRSEAREQLADAKIDLATAENSLALKRLQAEQTLNDTLTTAGSAETTYQLQLQTLEYSIQARELEVQNIQAKIEEVNSYLADSILYSPCDGLVAGVSYQAGAEVDAKTTIATVSDSAVAYVYVAVAQDDIGYISIGQQATLEMDAFDTLTFTGTVDSISTSPARNASGSASYNVTVLVDATGANIYEGMTGTCTLITRQEKDVLYVSYRAVYEKDGGTYVKIRDENGEIVEAAVRTGFSDGRSVAITEGLTEGQTVLIESQVSAQ